MKFGYLTRKIVATVITPLIAFQPIAGVAQQITNPYEQKRQQSSSQRGSNSTDRNTQRKHAAANTGSTENFGSNPYESGHSKQTRKSNESHQTASAQPPAKRQQNAGGNDQQRQASSAQPAKRASTQQADAGRQAQQSERQADAQEQQQAGQRVGDSNNSKLHLQASVLGHKHMATSSFNVSTKTGAVTENYTVDHLNALWGRGKNLKLALTYKSTRGRSIYLPTTNEKITKNSLKKAVPACLMKPKNGWDLGFPAIYQQAKAVDEANSQKSYWKLKWQGRTYTFRPSHHNTNGKPAVTTEFYEKNNPKWDSGQFIYSHLTGNKDLHSSGSYSVGSKLRITDVNMGKGWNSTITLKTANGITYVLGKEKNLFPRLDNEAYVIQRIAVPLKKPLHFSEDDDRAVKQLYTFHYTYDKEATRNRIHIYSMGLKENQPSGTWLGDTKTQVARITLGIDKIKHCGYHLKQLWIKTPDYSKNSKNLDNTVTVKYQYYKNGDIQLHSRNIHSIIGADNGTTTYKYNTVSWHHDNKKKTGPKLLSSITRPKGNAIKIDYHHLIAEGQVYHIHNHNSSGSHWHDYGMKVYPASQISYHRSPETGSYKVTDYNFHTLGTQGPTFEKAKSGNNGKATFVHPDVGSGFDPQHVYNSAFRLAYDSTAFGQRYGLPSSSHWLDPLFQTATDRKYLATQKKGDISDHYQKASKRRDALTNQHYGTVKKTYYPQSSKPERWEKYKYDNLGRLYSLQKKNILFKQINPGNKPYFKFKDIINKTHHEYTYDVGLDEVGNGKKYDTFYKLPMDWHKPSKIKTTITSAGQKTKTYITDKHYNQFGQVVATVTSGQYERGYLKGHYYRHASAEKMERPFPPVVAEMHFSNGQIGSASFTLYDYWTNNGSYPFPLVQTHKHGVTTWTAPYKLKDYAQKTTNLGDTPLPNDSYVTKIIGRNNSGKSWPDWGNKYAKSGPDVDTKAPNFSQEIKKVTQSKVTAEVNANNQYEQVLRHEGTEGKSNPVASSGSLRSTKRMNRYGFMTYKLTRTGTSHQYSYDKMGRPSKHKVAGKTVKKWTRGYHSDGSEAYYRHVIDPVHNKVTEYHYNSLGQLSTVKIKHQPNKKNKSPESYKVKSYFWSGTTLQTIVHNKYADKPIQKVGSVTHKPIYDLLMNQIGTYRKGQGLSHVHYSVLTSDAVVDVDFSFRHVGSDYTFYKPVTLTYHNKYTGLKTRTVTYSAERLNGDWLNHTDKPEFFAKGSATQLSNSIKKRGNKAKLKLVHALQNKTGKPNQKIDYVYTGDSHLLDQVKLSYPYADTDTKTIKDYHYNKYGQITYVEDRHGNHHRIVKNLLGQTVQHKVCPITCDQTHKTYHLGQKVHNALGQLIYEDVRPGPDSPNKWKDHATYNKYTYNGNGLIQKQEKANGTNLKYKFDEDPEALLEVKIKPSGSKKYKVFQDYRYNDFGMATYLKRHAPDGDIKAVRHIKYDSNQRPEKIVNKLINGSNSYKWHKSVKRNPLGHVYKATHQLPNGDSVAIQPASYTAQGNIKETTLTLQNGGYFDLSYKYQPTGKLHSIALGASMHAGGTASMRKKIKLSYSYDRNLRLQKQHIKYWAVTTSAWDLNAHSRLSYNKAGKIHTKSFTIQSNEIPGLSNVSSTYHYTYDNFGGYAGRLKKRTGDKSGQKEMFTYDSLGNIKKYSFGWNKMLYRYDSDSAFTLATVNINGKQTRHYTTNKQGRITQAGKTSIDYNPLGQVHKIKQGGRSVTYEYGLNKKPAIKHIRTSFDNKQAFKIAGMWSKPVDKPNPGKVYKNLRFELPHQFGKINFHKANHASSLFPKPLARATDATGNVRVNQQAGKGKPGYLSYSAFGALQHKSSNQDFKNAGWYGFDGQLTDLMTGFQYLGGNRLYDPAIGRFLQPDPDSPGKGGMNPYRFASNNPIMNKDPTGHYTEHFGTKAQFKQHVAQWKYDHACSTCPVHSAKQWFEKAGNGFSKFGDHIKHKWQHTSFTQSVKNSFTDPSRQAITTAVLAVAGAGIAIGASKLGMLAEDMDEIAEAAASLASEDSETMEVDDVADSVESRIRARDPQKPGATADEDTRNLLKSKIPQDEDGTTTRGKIRSKQTKMNVAKTGVKYFKDMTLNFITGHVSGGNQSYTLDGATKNLAFSAGSTIVGGISDAIGQDDRFAGLEDRVQVYGNAAVFSVKSHIHDWHWHGSAASWAQSYIANVINIGIMTGIGHGAGMINSHLEEEMVPIGYAEWFNFGLPTVGGQVNGH